MPNRPALLLLGLLVVWGCNPGGSRDFPEPPAGSYTPAVFQLRIAGETASVDGARVSPEFWSGTGIRPALGRSFVPEEYGSPSGPRVVLISHELWKQSLGSDPGTIGRAIELDGAPATIVGILPPGFRSPETARLWVPKAPGSE